MVFPTKEAAQRAQRFVEKRYATASRIASFEGLQALAVSESAYALGPELYWRFSGEVVSSRMAEDTLSRTPSPVRTDDLAFLLGQKVRLLALQSLSSIESGHGGLLSPSTAP